MTIMSGNQKQYDSFHLKCHTLQKTGKINSVAPGSTRPTATRPTVHGRYLSTPPPYLGALPCAPYCSKYQNSNLTLFSPHIATCSFTTITNNLVWVGRGERRGGRRAGARRGLDPGSASVDRRHVRVGLHGRGEEIGGAQGRCFGRS